MKYSLGCLVLLVGGIVNAADLKIVGEGVVSAPATLAYLNVSVVTNAITPSLALSTNSTTSDAVIKTLKTLNIKDSEIQTSNFYLTQKFAYEGRKEPELIGYIVSHDLQITVCDLKNVGPVLDAIIKVGVNKIHDVKFTASPDVAKAALVKARQEATTNVMGKADEYCNNFGLRRKNIKSISEYVSQPSRQSTYATADLSPSTNLVPSSVSYKVLVEVVWDVE